MTKQVSSVKYLGITISEKLQWSEHVSNATNKANSTLGFLRRNLNSCLPYIKSSCYKSPIIEYGSTVWDPHLHRDINKIENIHRRSARFIKNYYLWNSSVTSLVNDLEWQSLQSRR